MRRFASGVVDVWVGRARSDFVERILRRYLDLAPDLERGEHGKPALRTGTLHFNVSHAGELAALAVTAGDPIGIDVEYLRPGLDTLRLARRFCAPQEADALSPLATEQRDAACGCGPRKRPTSRRWGLGSPRRPRGASSSTGWMS
jgi:hypothetical protein